MKRLAPFILIFLLVALMPLSALAASAGKITRMRGLVEIISVNNEIRKAQVGEEVWEGEVVRTKSRSRAEIRFVDGSIMRLARNSKVKITEYKAAQERTRGVFNLFQGKIQNIVRRASGYFGRQKENRYEVHTPTAVCGVRGTDFLTSYIDGVTQSAVNSGIVYAFSNAMPGEVREVRAGQSMVVVASNQPPVIRPATDKDLILDDDAEENEGEAPPVQEGLNLGLEEDDLVSDGDTIDQPPSFGETYTIFEATLVPGTFDGTLYGQIGDTSNTGTMTVTATLPGPPGFGETAVDPVLGVTSNSGAFGGYLAGVAGSYEALFTSLWVEPDATAGYTYSFMSGDYSGDPVTLTTEGEAFRSEVLGTVPLEDPESWAPGAFPVSGALPEIASLPPSRGGTVCCAGTVGILIDNGNRWLGVWALDTSGGSIDPAFLPPGQSATFLYGDGSTASYYSLGYLTASDDGNGHVTIRPDADLPITYIDHEYIGAISTWYTGVHDGEGGSYNSVGAGTFTLDRMRYSGLWEGQPGTLYANQDGYFHAVGLETGLFGGIKSPWDNSSTDFFAMGEFSITETDYENAPLLWNSFVMGSGLNSSGSEEGFIFGATGGHWRTNGSMNGYAATLYAAPDGRAGLLTGYLSGSWYDGLDMWSVSGNLARRYQETLTGSPDEEWTDGMFMFARMTGDFNGNGYIEGGNSYDVESFIAFLTDGSTLADGSPALPGWGIYDLKLGDYNDFDRDSTNLTNWSARIGGYFGESYYYGGGGYYGFFHGNTSGTWSAAGEINGNLSATFQTRTHRGVMNGPFYGHNSSPTSSWVAESIGTWESSQAFDFSGTWGYDDYAAFWNYDPDGTYWFDNTGSHQGFAGGITNTDNALSLWLMGEYYWWDEISRSYLNFWTMGSDVDSPGGFGIATVGVADRDANGFSGVSALIQWDPDGNPGLYTGRNLAGSAYPLDGSMGIADLSGTLVPGMGGFQNQVSSFQENHGSHGRGSILLDKIAYQDAPQIESEPWFMSAFALTGTADGYDSERGTWQLYTEFNSANSINFIQILGDYWNMDSPMPQAGVPGNAFGGGLAGAWVNVNDGDTGISGGEVRGLFDPADASTWMAVGTLVNIRTEEYLAAVRSGNTQYQLNNTLNVPAWEVGVTDFTQGENPSAGGGGTLSGVFMNQVGFFAMSGSDPPTIWATDSVGGSYTGTPLNTTAPLTSAHISGGVDFKVVHWDGSHWGAAIDGYGTVSGMGTSMDGQTIGMAGGAAGAIDAGANAFSGTGAGVVNEPVNEPLED